MLEAYGRQLLAARALVPEVTITWQDGEPTLMGVDFLRRAVALTDRHRRPGQRVQHTIQTNGTMLTDEWCELQAVSSWLLDGSPRPQDGPEPPSTA
jgi:serine-type anaerobic sulfatase-maturating enzyme